MASESKVIVVTGASRGIGLAIAKLLVHAGHKVVLTARGSEEMKLLCSQYPNQVQYLVGDMADASVCLPGCQGDVQVALHGKSLTESVAPPKDYHPRDREVWQD